MLTGLYLPYISPYPPISPLYLQARFLSMLTDDRAQASMSYVEFLCQLTLTLTLTLTLILTLTLTLT